LGEEKKLLIDRFKKTLVRVVIVAENNRLDIRDLLLGLYKAGYADVARARRLFASERCAA
jgi:hypothetical protein